MSPASVAGAGGRRVTVRSMSCRGVKAFVPFQKPPLYAAVSLGGHREKTPPDADGGENPDWEGAVVAFDLDGDTQQQQEQLVQFEVKAQVPLLGNKLVGTASVPVADLAAGGGGAGGLRHVSYQVRAPDGKANGTLSFAYAISSGAGGARPQPQHNTVPDAPPPEQGSSFCSAPPAVTAYPAPALATANFAPQGGGYPPPPPAPVPPVSSSLYPPLQDLLPSSTYPPPPSTLPHPTTTNPHFPEPNSSCYPPPPPDSYPAPPPQYISSYPPQPQQPSSYPPQPQPPSSYPPPPPSGYPPPFSNLVPSTSSYPPPSPSGYPPPLSNLVPSTSTYPPPPPPESGSAYPVLPRSTPSPPSSTVDRELQYYPAPPSGSYYPPPELHGAARTPYYYP